MNATLTAPLVFALFSGAILLGQVVGRRLPATHLSADSKDAVKLAMGLVATMTALLLGLLVSSAKDGYDTQRRQVIQIAANIVLLDRTLAMYGPEAAEMRAQLGHETTEAMNRIWHRGPGKEGIDPSGGNALFLAFLRLTPKDDAQRSLRAQAVTVSLEIGQTRSLLMAQAVPSVSAPLVNVLIGWLLLTFFIFSLLAPPNATTLGALTVSALSVAVAIFLVLELDRPFGGWIEISSQPFEMALKQLGK